MTFDDIPAGSRVFIDANVFIFHFAPHPALQAPCQVFLERIARHEITGITSPDVMQAHRLSALASSDADFDRVPGLSRYEPV